MAIETVALAIVACDRRFRPQMKEPFFEAVDLRGGLLRGNLCVTKEVGAVLEDVFERVIGLYSEDLVPIREHVLRERADALLRRVLAEISTDYLVSWPFAGAADLEGGDGTSA
jgi:hypothetical protein